MYQGFYDLTSGMLTQRRALNTISNNMVNIQTAGYKSDQMVSQTFREEMLIRTGRTNKKSTSDLAVTSKINSASRTYTDYSQGGFDVTDDPFDVALSGNGFFKIQTANGAQYTRNGAFSVDDQGYLKLDNIGEVLDANDQPIRLTNEDFTIDSEGNIIQSSTPERANADGSLNQAVNDQNAAEGSVVAKLKVVDFQDYGRLHKEDNGMYTTNQAEQTPDDTSIVWKSLENSNVDMVSEMTSMISAQRAYQSSAQMLKMYDTILNASANTVGRL